MSHPVVVLHGANGGAAEVERLSAALRPFVVGYGLGGRLALYVARHFPKRVRGACAIATKGVFDAKTVKHWSYLASPARLGRPGNPRAGQLAKLHAPQDCKEVALANIRFFEELGRAPPLSNADLEAIEVRIDAWMKECG